MEALVPSPHLGPTGLPTGPTGLPTGPTGLPSGPAGLPTDPTGLPQGPTGPAVSDGKLDAFGIPANGNSEGSPFCNVTGTTSGRSNNASYRHGDSSSSSLLGETSAELQGPPTCDNGPLAERQKPTFPEALQPTNLAQIKSAPSNSGAGSTEPRELQAVTSSSESNCACHRPQKQPAPINSRSEFATILHEARVYRTETHDEPCHTAWALHRTQRYELTMSHLLDDLEHSLLEGSPDEFDWHDGDKEQRRSVLEKHLARLDDIEQDFGHCRKQWWLFTKTLHSGPRCPQSMYAHTGPYVLQWSRSARDEWKMYMARAVEYDYWERLERHRTEYRQELENLDLTQAERNARDALFVAQVQARILSMRNNNRAQRALPVISQACTPHSEPGGTTTAEVLARSNHESTQTQMSTQSLERPQ